MQQQIESCVAMRGLLYTIVATTTSVVVAVASATDGNIKAWHITGKSTLLLSLIEDTLYTGISRQARSTYEHY